MGIRFAILKPFLQHDNQALQNNEKCRTQLIYTDKCSDMPWHVEFWFYSFSGVAMWHESYPGNTGKVKVIKQRDNRMDSNNSPPWRVPVFRGEVLLIRHLRLRTLKP